MTGRHVMAQDVSGIIIAPDLEIAMIGREPSVQNVLDLDHALVQEEAAGCFLATITRVTFNLDDHDAGLSTVRRERPRSAGERVNRVRYRTRDEARADLFDYIEVFYNRKRRHGYLGKVSPADFEEQSAGSF